MAFPKLNISATQTNGRAFLSVVIQVVWSVKDVCWSLGGKGSVAHPRDFCSGYSPGYILKNKREDVGLEAAG